MAIRPSDFDALRDALAAGNDDAPGPANGGPLTIESLEGTLRRVGPPPQESEPDSFPIPWLRIDCDDVDIGTRCSVFRRHRAVQRTVTSIIDVETEEVLRSMTSPRWSFVDVVPGHVLEVRRVMPPAPGDVLVDAVTPAFTVDEVRSAAGLPALPRRGPALGLLAEIVVRCEDDGVARIFGVTHDYGPMRHAMNGCPRRGGRALVVGKHPHEIHEDELARLKLFTTTSVR